MSHTPPPWYIHEANGFRCVSQSPDGLGIKLAGLILTGSEDGLVCKKEDLEFIIHCVNNHQRLVDAIQKLDKCLQNLHGAVEWGKTYDLDIAALNQAYLALDAVRGIK